MQAFMPNPIARWVFPLCREQHNGKTHLATAVGVRVRELGMVVKFYTVEDLVMRLSEAKRGGGLDA
ncbi:hypothetical protein AAC03nite_13130 [Alicyclobacillus acidoterrestris]|nr:hypothetical protein AAC03nite_13130 [Alicyclobacillus acidoterrestris]